MLSTSGSTIATTAPQPVSGTGTRRDRNACKVRHDRSARRAGGRALLASAPPNAPPDAHRNGVRGSPGLRARETQQHLKVPCSGPEPNHVEALKAKSLSTHLCANGSSIHRVSEREARPFPFRSGFGGHAADPQRSGLMPALRKPLTCCLERDGAAQQPETQIKLPRSQQMKRSGRICTASSCIHDLLLPERQRVHARCHCPCPRDLIHLGP